MPPSKKTVFSLTARQEKTLSATARSRTHKAALVLRSNIILRYARTGNKNDVTRHCHSTRDIVYLWIDRWQEHAVSLTALEDTADDKELTRAIVRVLSDRQRPGAPPKFTEQQKQEIIALAADKPNNHGIPVTQWSHKLLAAAAAAKGIVPSISSAHTGRFLKTSHP